MATIGEIRNLEAELERKRKVVAASLKAERKKRALSLRQVARRVQLTPSNLMNIERGDSWRTGTVERIVRFYARTEGKTHNGQARLKRA